MAHYWIITGLSGEEKPRDIGPFSAADEAAAWVSNNLSHLSPEERGKLRTDGYLSLRGHGRVLLVTYDAPWWASWKGLAGVLIGTTVLAIGAPLVLAPISNPLWPKPGTMLWKLTYVAGMLLLWLIAAYLMRAWQQIRRTGTTFPSSP